jgi:dimethylhistidine N-methyltransferase
MQRQRIACAAAHDVCEFESRVIEGLSRPRKSIPCRFFYDERGSRLFEQITLLPEYYLTRTETQILETYAAEITRDVPAGAVLIEFGSGASRKTEILLKVLPQLRAYVPVDVSSSALEAAKRRLSGTFPHLEVRPALGDFSQPIAFPPDLTHSPKLGFFPGSTIGNFTPLAASQLLRMIGRLLAGGRLIIGADLKKDTGRLLRAYNDEAGLTAAFNLNLLARLNRELAGTFDLSGFRHEAIYNVRESRMEMYLVSLREQTATVRGRAFLFSSGERIHTENSYKHSIRQFQELARSAGCEPRRFWCDAEELFSVHELAFANG